MDKKWKKIILISSIVLGVLAVVGIILLIIINIGNINSIVNVKAKDCIGGVTVDIVGAENSRPYSYNDFDNTTDDVNEFIYENEKLMLKSNSSSITINITIKNMSYFDTYIHIDRKGPYKNSKLEFFVDDLYSEVVDDFVLSANQSIVLSYKISKANTSWLLSTDFGLDISITKNNPYDVDDSNENQNNNNDTNQETTID